ncbi:MAG: hypothetical protein GX163_08660 [Bacteroidetes bacterium]|jgi:hypothetical protein|nr:hypothetical protein [Bacteroidota bacterium]
MKTNFNIIIIISVVLALLFFSFLLQKNAESKAKEYFEIFNAAHLDNRIEEVDIAYKGVRIKLDDNREFIFFPYTDKTLNKANIFVYTAKKGDRIIKKAYADTIYLEKDNERLAYKFQKF